MHKKCPFCGGEPEYCKRYEQLTPFEECEVKYIRCSVCGASTEGVYNDLFADDNDYRQKLYTEDDAWGQWDRRVNENA